jgi:hypothetical protein
MIEVALKESELDSETFRVRDIISIHPRNVSASCHPKADVKRLCKAQVPRIAVAENARIFTRVEQRSGSVGGTIVDDDEFEIPKTLLEDAVEGSLKVSVAIVDRHQHTYFGRRLDMSRSMIHRVGHQGKRRRMGPGMTRKTLHAQSTKQLNDKGRRARAAWKFRLARDH